MILENENQIYNFYCIEDYKIIYFYCSLFAIEDWIDVEFLLHWSSNRLPFDFQSQTKITKLSSPFWFVNHSQLYHTITVCVEKFSSLMNGVGWLFCFKISNGNDLLSSRLNAADTVIQFY